MCKGPLVIYGSDHITTINYTSYFKLIGISLANYQ